MALMVVSLFEHWHLVLCLSVLIWVPHFGQIFLVVVMVWSPYWVTWWMAVSCL